MDNAAIIEQCASGSKEAMEALYCRYSHRMMRVIRRYVSDAKCSEDILHDGFVLIFTHIAEVRQSDKLEFWMGTIMKNLCLNYLSNLDVLTMLDEEVDYEDIPDLEDILSYEELELLINKLPDGYRTVFKLAVLEGKSHKEIGRLLGISPNSSSSQLFHAKALLRKLIIERKKQAGLLALVLLAGFGLFYVFFEDRTDKTLSDSPAYIASENTHIIEEADETLPVVEPEREVTVSSVVKTVHLPAYQPETVLPIIADTLVPVSESPVEEAVVEPDKVEIQQEPDHVADTERMSGRKYTYRDIPKSSMAGVSGWKIGAHYTVGTQTPSAQGDYLFSNPFDAPDLSDEALDGSSVIGFPNYSDWAFPSPGTPMTPKISYDRDIDYSLPVTLGVTLSKELLPNLSLEAGLNYTYMHADVRYISIGLHQNVKSSFLGVPVKVAYTFWRPSRLSFYGAAGMSLDIPVGKQVKVGGKSKYPDPVVLPALKSKPEFSVLGGVGAQFAISDRVGLYIEPSIKYYFKNNATSPSYWQEHRTIISIPIGIKINL